MSKKPLIAFAIVAAVVLVPVARCVSTYNGLVRLGQPVQFQWTQVDNTHQRRALVPNLVATVKGAGRIRERIPRGPERDMNELPDEIDVAGPS
jgi:hypothetical protein